MLKKKLEEYLQNYKINSTCSVDPIWRQISSQVGEFTLEIISHMAGDKKLAVEWKLKARSGLFIGRVHATPKQEFQGVSFFHEVDGVLEEYRTHFDHKNYGWEPGEPAPKRSAVH